MSTYRSEKENVDEDVLRLGSGPLAVEIDIMQVRVLCGLARIWAVCSIPACLRHPGQTQDRAAL